jgi:hypothetical protein
MNFSDMTIELSARHQLSYTEITLKSRMTGIYCRFTRYLGRRAGWLGRRADERIPRADEHTA